MDYRSNYVPKTKKVNYKIVVPFLFVLALLIVYGINALRPTPVENQEQFAFCRMTPEESRSVIKKNLTDNVIEFSDYGVYGQSLGLYGADYQVTTADPFNGRTVFLTNLCTGTEQVFLMGSELDAKIPMNALDPGFYIVEVSVGFERSRLIADEKMDEVFHATSRGGEAREVRLIANKNLFNTDEETIMDQHYAFLDVKNTQIDANTYDVVLDPSGLYDDMGMILHGSEFKDFVESKEMYRMAEAIEAQLTSAGYKVKIVREKDKPRDTNDVNGRLHAGYLADAKYYVNLTMLQQPYPKETGASIIYSSHATSRMASTIAKQLEAQTTLELFDYGSHEGIVQTSKVDGYDNNAKIREAGGRFTGAGVLEEFREWNTFAKDSNRGMQGTVIEFGYIEDAKAYETWFAEFDQIAKAVADGIAIELAS